ncbi:CcoQ/FixQ family Cbb3-type cytochrome c oxidase assembly chaperone [Salipiger mucosus]|uniref:Cytochrome c oxidase subunit CcoQ n=1 Tax=Salipiger mucosus DSM 16094 TaxID=1123237 RepID=S9S5U8_9RHOB|nr:CcoQ/FixQ family Cbb3-type cytochrome c oxidase assembly chaperone [Salipiger mucosus]EPX85550.1 Cytochrome c oxidase subunit CcoQ [Salipiger mucosus DSM 16094]
METYSLLRQFADSWMLLVLFLFFIGVIVWAFRPGSTKAYESTRNIPFRHEDAPAAADASHDKPAQNEEART